MIQRTVDVRADYGCSVTIPSRRDCYLANLSRYNAGLSTMLEID